jgi:hypothetical protein
MLVNKYYSAVKTYLDAIPANKPVNTTEILSAIGVAVRYQSVAHRLAIRKIMTAYGYEYKSKRIGLSVTKSWRKVFPPVAVAIDTILANEQAEVKQKASKSGLSRCSCPGKRKSWRNPCPACKVERDKRDREIRKQAQEAGFICGYGAETKGGE